MSDSLAYSIAGAYPAPASAPASRPHIEVVPTRDQRRARPRLFYAIVACSGVAAIFIVKLLLSVAVSQGAYEVAALQSDSSDLTRQVQAASEDLARATSPQYLAANAEALGMVTNPHPAYLRLSDHAVLGAPQSAEGASVLGGAESYVPNALLAGVPLVTDLSASAAPAPAAASAATETATPPAPPTALPTPVTH